MTTVSSDHNLLFGILAMQLDIISREDLIAATSVWIQDKSRPLEEILLQKQLVGEDEQQILTSLVTHHLGKARAGASEKATHDASGSITDTAEMDAPLADTQVGVGALSKGGERFRILRPLARGGLGQVWVSQDAELPREVAVKEMLEQYADDELTRSRFLMEAEITGSLEHPGVVPVYGMGFYEDGRPFYAMRLIRGESLKDAIERFHHPDKTQQDPQQREVELRRLLGSFLDVCNTVEYAHSRQVIHRDLKPSNVMLGEFGETLVVDWGLAKVSKTQSEFEDRTSVTLFKATSETSPGMPVGTPAYMSPEQAAGDPELVGEASDVYGLGATLYHMLTGRPAFTEKNLVVLLQMVRQGDFPAPRKVKPDIDPAFEAVVLKAMATEPTNRYSSARELEDDLRKVMAGQAVLCQERWATRTRFESFMTSRIIAQRLAASPGLKDRLSSDFTILSCGIRGFARICQHLDEQLSVKWRNAVIDSMSECIVDHGGIVVETLGDELTAIWSSLESPTGHASGACQAALAMVEHAERLSNQWHSALDEPTVLFLGLHSSTATAAAGQQEPRRIAIEDAINETARARHCAHDLLAPLVVSRATHGLLANEFATRRLRAQDTEVFQVVQENDERWHDLKKRYERGLGEFEHNNYQAAAATLSRLLKKHPDDGPAQMLLAEVANSMIAADLIPPAGVSSPAPASSGTPA